VDERPADHVEDGAAFRAVARPGRRTPAAIAVGAVAVVAVAFLTRTAAPAVGQGTEAATPQGSPSQVVASAAPAFAPVVMAIPLLPGRDPDATPHPTAGAIAVHPGPVTIVPAERTGARVSVVLGEGWVNAGDGFYTHATDAAATGLSFGVWSVDRVHVFPCRWSASEFTDPQLVRTTAGLAHALSSWWGQDPGMPADSNAPIAPVATRPERSTLASHPAWYVEVLIPSGLDLDECDGMQLILWEAEGGVVRPALAPGEVIGLWVVDLDGEPVVIAASKFLTAAPETAAVIEAVVDSIVIEPGVR
jgi:hypothetical protein